MSTLNKMLIIGRVGKDPTLSYTKSGKAVANFSVATSGYGKDDPVEWHRITVWDKLAETCNQYLSKGKLVYVEGRLATRSYEKDGDKHYITEVIANSIQFLSPSDKETKNETKAPLIQQPATMPNYDDVPF